MAGLLCRTARLAWLGACARGTALERGLQCSCSRPSEQDWGARIGAASGLRGFSTPPPPRKPFAVRGREPREGEDKQGRDRDSLKWGGRHNEEGDDWSDPNSFLGLLDDNDNFENPVWGNEFREGETGVAREEQGSPGPATDAPVLADGVVSKDDEKGAAEGAEERVELALGLAGTFVTLKKSLLRECDPDALETGYAFNGMDKGAIAAVDKQDVGGIQRWASDNTLVPHFKFTLGVPYAPVHLSPFHRGEHLTAQSKTRHLPQLTDRDRKPASDADIEELTSFTNPDFLKQFLSEEGYIISRKRFPYLQKKVHRRVVRSIKSARQMALLDIFSRRTGGAAGSA